MEQLNLFDFPKYKIKNKIRLIELFAGIGSQAMALRNIGANFESWRVCEFDKYAIASYNAIFGTNYATSDIQKLHAEDLGIIDRDNYTYLMTYSFPCTDLSIAGKMAGMKRNSGTRSGLLWEVERLLIESKQNLRQVLLMENVPQVHGEQNKIDFDNWCNFLRSKGYHNFYDDLNAKDFGIPQNRERCFMVSILSDDFIDFEFPKPIELETVMKDFLEEKVDEKYYINSEKADRLIEQLIESGVLAEQNRTEQIAGIDLCVKNPKERQVANCITALYNNHGICAQEGNGVIEYVGNYRRDAPQGYSGSVYKTSGISPCCNARDYKEPIMIVDEYEKGK